MEALGQRWVTRKVAAMMDVFFEFEAQDDGIKTALKTKPRFQIKPTFLIGWQINVKKWISHFENPCKLKNIDTKLLYNGVTHTKGLADDEVRIFSIILNLRLMEMKQSF